MKLLRLPLRVVTSEKWIMIYLISFSFLTTSYAQWSSNSTINNAVAVALAGDYKNEPRIVSDGAGGAIIVWYDTRNGVFNSDIFAQRINAAGVLQWATNGVGISLAYGDQYIPSVIPDGAGGAIITWQDFRNGTSNPDIYAQRINSAGVVQWATDGVAICSAINEQYTPVIVSSNNGGAIIAWQDSRMPGNSDIYAQLVNGSGVIQWTANGVSITSATGSQSLPKITTDGSNGAIISWQDVRSGSYSDIYAQRINAAGATQWALDGVPISTATDDQNFPSIVSDDANGALITWQDFRGGVSDIYAQRVNSTGVVQWIANGVAVCNASDYQYNPVIASDGSNGAIITWYDVRNGNQDIFAQRINATGSVSWMANGIAISTVALTQSIPTIISDGTGGAIITWQDQRNGNSNGDVFAQRINNLGAVQWANNGIAIGNSSARDEYKPYLASDGAGGAIIAWNAYDIPSYSKADIYAQKVNANGTLGGGDPNPCPPLLTLVSTADDYSSGTMTKQAAASNGKIEATNLITGSANITYEANSIELKPGFRADNGTVFKAQIGGCGGQ